MDNNSLFKLEIIDTPGDERSRSIVFSFCKAFDCCILIYNITDKRTFDVIKEIYIPTIKEEFKENLIILLVGNKSDLENQREVTKEEGIELAKNNKYMFIETSCIKNNTNEMFELLLKYIKNELEKNPQSIGRIRKNNKKKNNKENCLVY